MAFFAPLSPNKNDTVKYHSIASALIGRYRIREIPFIRAGFSTMISYWG